MNTVENPSGSNPVDKEFEEIFSTYLPQDLKSRDIVNVLSVGCGFAYEAFGLLATLPQAKYRGIDTNVLQVEVAVRLHHELPSERFQVEILDAFQANNLGKDNDLIIVRNPDFTVNRATQELQTPWAEVFGNCVGALKIGGYMFLTATEKAELEHTTAIINQDPRISIINPVISNVITQTAKDKPFRDDYITIAKRIA